MALKFVTTPVKRQGIKKRIPRKSLLLSTAKPVVIKQDYAAIDQFGELSVRKREAAEIARRLGHDLLPWHQRANDPAGRWNAFCASCNRLAVVCTEAPEDFPDIYGKALTQDCAGITP
jgi:hypothetical protein